MIKTIRRQGWYDLWLQMTKDGQSDRMIAQTLQLDAEFVATLRRIDGLPVWERDQWFAEEDLPPFSLIQHRVCQENVIWWLMVSLFFNGVFIIALTLTRG